MSLQGTSDTVILDVLEIGSVPGGDHRVLAGALARVATTPQDRYVTQRLFGDRLGRTWQVRAAFVLGLTTLLAFAGAVLVGAFLRTELVTAPTEPSNGWLAYSAGGDIYLTDGANTSRRVVGSDNDNVDQACPWFIDDGMRLAYFESVGLGSFPGGPGESTWVLIVRDVAVDGTLTDPVTRLALPHSRAEGGFCDSVAWDEATGRFAYIAAVFDGGGLYIGNPTGNIQMALPGPAAGEDFALGPVAWSTGASMVAVVRSFGPQLHTSELLAIRAAHAAADVLVHGSENELIDGIAWSPNGTSVLYQARPGTIDPTGAMTELEAIVRSVRVDIAAHPVQDTWFPSLPAWSPDGQRVAYVGEGKVIVAAPDGTSKHALAIRMDRSFYASCVSWSPDGRRLLAVGGDADFVDRGVRFTLISVAVDGDPAVEVIRPWGGLYRICGASWQALSD